MKNMKSSVIAALLMSLLLAISGCGGGNGEGTEDGGADTGQQGDAAVDSGGDADGDADADTDADSDTDTDTDTDVDSDADTDADSDTDTDTDTDADSDADAGDSGADANEDAGIDSGSGYSGQYQWHTFHGGNGEDDGYDVAVDGDGNIYITGYSTDTWNGPDGQEPLHEYTPSTCAIFVLKLSKDGDYVWHTFYGSSGNSGGWRIAVDSLNHVYVLGWSDTSWNGSGEESPLYDADGAIDLFVLKLSKDGDYLWHTFYGASGSCYGNGLAVTDNGLVYVTGNSAASWTGSSGQEPKHAYHGGTDMFVLKLSTNGAYIWHTFFGSSITDVAKDIEVYENGNVYASGTAYAGWNGPSDAGPLHAYGGNTDIMVLALSSNGDYVWHAFFGTDSDDEGHGIAVDSDGNVLASGWSTYSWNGPGDAGPLEAHHTEGTGDILVLKLSPGGDYLWHTFHGSSVMHDYVDDIAVDSQGNAYTTGYSGDNWHGPDDAGPLHAYSGGIKDISILKLSESGEYQWHTIYGSSLSEEGCGMALSDDGYLYTTGWSVISWNGPDDAGPLHEFTGVDDDFHILKLKQ